MKIFAWIAIPAGMALGLMFYLVLANRSPETLAPSATQPTAGVTAEPMVSPSSSASSSAAPLSSCPEEWYVDQAPKLYTVTPPPSPEPERQYFVIDGKMRQKPATSEEIAWVKSNCPNLELRILA